MTWTDKAILLDVIRSSELLKHERQKLTSPNLVLLLEHDLLFSKGIQAGDGPIKQAVLRHKTRLHAELTKLRIKRGVKSLEELAQTGDVRAGGLNGKLKQFYGTDVLLLLYCLVFSDQIPRYIRINTLLWKAEQAGAYFTSKGYEEGGDPLLSQ